VNCFLPVLALCSILGLTSCATTSRHRFDEPSTGCQIRNGQLLYQTTTTSLIGEAVVRFSANGDFALTFFKGPGVPLLELRQDAHFVDVKGALARNGWSGQIDRAPERLRGWLGLRDAFLRAPNQKVVRYSNNSEKFVFRG